jgi:hypothetical protein
MDLGRSIDEGESDRQSKGRQLGAVSDDDKRTLGLFERGGTWKYRREVTVFPQSEEHPFQRVMNLLLVETRGLLGIIECGRRAVDILFGKRHPVQEGFTCHALIAFRMIRRNETLVRPEDVDILPRNGVPILRR